MDYIEFEASVNPLEIGRDVLIAQLAEVGFESFVETENGLQAYIQQECYNDNLLEKVDILSNNEFKIEYKLAHIADQNWNKTWEENFEPINVEDKCYIRAPFHEIQKSIDYDIVIDPKMSFGTGHHATTYLMVKRLLSLDVTNKATLDMGCGTAVLAILAKLKGSGYTEAIDIDDWAYNNSLENIRNNNCEDIAVKKGGAELLGSYQFDIILANINRNILLADMAKYAKNLVFGGSLLLSGFFKSDIDILISEATNNNLTLTYSESKNDWIILHLIKT